MANLKVIETDGSFFDDLRSMERSILTERGDTEALAILDAEEAEMDADDDADEE
jgi:hypothetical protein